MLFNQLVYCRFRLSPSIWSRNRRISTRTPSWSGHKRSTRTRAAGHTCSHVSSLRWTTVVTLGEYLIPYHVRHTSPLNSERETLKKPMKPCPNKLHSLFSLSLTLFLSLSRFVYNLTALCGLSFRLWSLWFSYWSLSLSLHTAHFI